MMDYLEKFEEVLENENKGQLLRMLLFACAEKVKHVIRVVAGSHMVLRILDKTN